MDENRSSAVGAAICVLKSLAFSAAVSGVFLLIFALGLCSAPDPAALAFPFGLGALYAGAFAGGAAGGRLLGAGPLSGAISGGAYCALVFLAGLGAKNAGRPWWQTGLLLLGVIASGAAGAYLTQNRKKKKRPDAKRIRERAAKARRGAKRPRRT